MWHNVTISCCASASGPVPHPQDGPWKWRHGPANHPTPTARGRWCVSSWWLIYLLITDCDYDYYDYYYYVSLYRIVFIDIMMPLAVRHPNLWLVCDLVSSMKIHLYRVSTYNNWLSDAFSCHTESCPSKTFHAMHPMGIYHFLSPFTIQSS